jgi:hypothetical protein
MDQTLVLPAPQRQAIRDGSAITKNGRNIGNGSGIVDGLPKNKVTLTYCTTAYETYGHKFQCDSYA